jgi:hypothetical protein
MASALKKIKPQEFRVALGLVDIGVNENTASIILDTVLAIDRMGLQFDVKSAVEILVKHQEAAKEKSKREQELKIRYRTLSELHEPKSQHKLHKQIGVEMESIIKELENLK